MSVLKFASEDFPEVLPRLLEIWPETGEWDEPRLAELKKVAKEFGAPSPPDPLLVDLSISKERLRQFGETLAATYSTPWKYQKYFNPGTPLNAQSLKLRPGAQIGFAIEGFSTTGRVNTIRRINYQGDPNYVKTDITWSTKNIPLYLDGETKCTCRYCGTKPTGEEEECRKCGAPLPDC